MSKLTIVERVCAYCGHENVLYERTILWVCEQCGAVNGDERFRTPVDNVEVWSGQKSSSVQAVQSR